MNRLQNLTTERPVIVTMNPSREPRDVEREFSYHHPQFDARAVTARGRIGSLQGTRRTWFSGSYLGSGFHEDGLRAGLEVASGLGSPPPWAGTAAPPPSRVYATMGA
jgi:predicted NAD/FAD-binding protein